MSVPWKQCLLKIWTGRHESLELHLKLWNFIWSTSVVNWSDKLVPGFCHLCKLGRYVRTPRPPHQTHSDIRVPALVAPESTVMISLHGQLQFKWWSMETKMRFLFNFLDHPKIKIHKTLLGRSQVLQQAILSPCYVTWETHQGFILFLFTESFYLLQLKLQRPEWV